MLNIKGNDLSTASVNTYETLFHLEEIVKTVRKAMLLFCRPMILLNCTAQGADDEYQDPEQCDPAKGEPVKDVQTEGITSEKLQVKEVRM